MVDPRTGEPLVIDLSYADLGATDPAELKASGVDGVGLGVWSRMNPPHEMADLGDLCMRGGLRVEFTYGLTYFGSEETVMRDTRWAVELAPNFKAPQVFADVEIDACDIPGWEHIIRPTPLVRVAELQGVLDHITGAQLIPGIYSGEPFWRNQMANETRWKDVAFWLANYAANDGLQEPIRRVLFGGPFLNLAGVQFTSEWGLQGGGTPSKPRGGRANRDASWWYQEDQLALREELDSLRGDLNELMMTFGGWAFTAPVGEPDADGNPTNVVLTGWDVIHYLNKVQDSFAEGYRLLQIAVAGADADQDAAIAQLRGLLARLENKA